MQGNASTSIQENHGKERGDCEEELTECLRLCKGRGNAVVRRYDALAENRVDGHRKIKYDVIINLIGILGY